jgi:cell division protein FtsI (penicillin-binding protein 3)
MPQPLFFPRRAQAVIAFILVAMITLIFRVGYLQTYGAQQNILRAERQHHQRSTLHARRGSIFDANGMLLAGTVQKESVFVDPKFMFECLEADGKSPAQVMEIIRRLADCLELDPAYLQAKLEDRSHSRFVPIARQVDELTAAEALKLDVPGLGVIPENVRYYPMGSVAAHVLGGVGKDGSGLEGVELQFDRLLAGKNGYQRTLKDARRRPIGIAAEDYLPPRHGEHLVLTIDANIQLIAEQELASVCQNFQARAGEVIVMDPSTGDVLALANYPTFNPQNLEDSTPEIRRNACLVMPYEPGSTIKPFIVAPALAWKLARANEVFPINGPTRRTSYGRTITDVYGYPKLSTWDILVKSSNIGMTYLVDRMGNEKLRGALIRAGFGATSGIELPGEDPGRISPLKKWTKYSAHSIAQGYEMLVTPLQLARGMCIFANGGRLVPVRLVRGTVDGSGRTIPRQPPDPLEMLPEVIDRRTALEVRRILADVMARGTGNRAKSSIYTVFGKTGTAHSARNGSYNQSNYTSSFIGGAPYENPRLVVAFIVHDPATTNRQYYGGIVAAPGGTRVLERALTYLQVPPSPELAPPPPQIADTLYLFDPKVYRKSTQRTASAQD